MERRVQAGQSINSGDNPAFANKDAPRKPKVRIAYTNHRGLTGTRIVSPVQFYHGTTEHYPEECYLMQAFCTERNAMRTFAMNKIVSWEEL